MTRKLAIKKLKASDLSFFQSYLTRHPQAKQKAFNLDQKIFEEHFFPALSAELDVMPEKRAPVALTFFGPAGAPPHQLMRKVLKQQKNWRLNGEVVHDPEDGRDRYGALEPEDLAVMEFTGAGYPNGIKIVLLSASAPEDAATFSALTAAFPGDSMSVITEETLEVALANVATPARHPIRDWLDKALLEEIGFGSAEAEQHVYQKRSSRGLSPAELKAATTRAEAVGHQGEEILDYYFSTQIDWTDFSYEWVASVNAVSPYDFLLMSGTSAARHADAKSTAGAFTNPIHLSMAEIRHALSSGIPYDIYRLFDVRPDGASLRIARDIGNALAPISKTLESLPAGVKVDSLSIDPRYFDFPPVEILITYGD